VTTVISSYDASQTYYRAPPCPSTQNNSCGSICAALMPGSYSGNSWSYRNGGSLITFGSCGTYSPPYSTGCSCCTLPQGYRRVAPPYCNIPPPPPLYPPPPLRPPPLLSPPPRYSTPPPPRSPPPPSPSYDNDSNSPPSSSSSTTIIGVAVGAVGVAGAGGAAVYFFRRRRAAAAASRDGDLHAAFLVYDSDDIDVPQSVASAYPKVKA